MAKIVRYEVEKENFRYVGASEFREDEGGRGKG